MDPEPALTRADDIFGTRNLITELSRSVNLIIEAARQEIDPGFRILQGFVLSIEPGLMRQYLIREEYEGWDWTEPRPFPSLDEIRSAIEAAELERGHDFSDVDVRTLAV